MKYAKRAVRADFLQHAVELRLRDDPRQRCAHTAAYFVCYGWPAHVDEGPSEPCCEGVYGRHVHAVFRNDRIGSVATEARVEIDRENVLSVAQVVAQPLQVERRAGLQRLSAEEQAVRV